MAAASTAPTPMATTLDVILNSVPKDDAERAIMERVPYREVIGSLMYIACKTRPDITYAVNILARFVNGPSIIHWKSAKRILRYLRGTHTKGVYIGGYNADKSRDEIIAYSDSDFAGDTKDRKSTGAYIVLLNGGLIAWRSFKESCVAISTTEAEYIALATCVRQVSYMSRILRDLGVMFHTPSTIYEDNAACIKWTEVDTKSSRHISVRYHIAREAVSARKVRIEYCESSKMLADALTKALGPQKYRPLIDMYPMGDTNAGANSRHP